MKNDRIIFHLDLNYFFARCEEILNPALASRAFCIANNIGYSVIATANPLARQCGIKSAMLVANAKKLCRTLICVEPHHMYYKNKSNEFFDCVRRNYTNDIEIMSIDECFIDVTDLLDNFHGNVEIMAQNMIDTIYCETKLFVTIGIGNNKFLAKMAGDTKPDTKIATLFKDEIQDKLWTKDIGSCINVGKKTKEFLYSLNIYKVIDFLKYENQDLLKTNLHKKYFQLLECFIGESDASILVNEPEKSISQSRTYHIALESEYDVLKELKFLSNEVSIILERKQVCGCKIGINYRFEFDDKTKTKSHSLNYYIWNTKEIVEEATKLLNQIWDKQTPIKLIGVSISDLMKIDDVSFEYELF